MKVDIAFKERMNQILERAILQGKRSIQSSIWGGDIKFLLYKLRVNQEEYDLIKKNLRVLNNYKCVKGDFCWEIEDVCLSDTLDKSYIIFIA